MTVKTTHRPSGLTVGALTRFIIHSVSCVMGFLFDVSAEAFAEISTAATRAPQKAGITRILTHCGY